MKEIIVVFDRNFHFPKKKDQSTIIITIILDSKY